MANSTNAAEFTVSEISYAVKSSIEDQFGYVRVRGELGRVSRPASGHIYLDLKDDKSVLNGVIWRGAAQKMTVRPEQGLEVIATGKLTTFPGQSKYQMVIDRMEPAGAGALMALLEERKKKLASEGLFAPERKKRLPYLPRVIGVVTSPSGAVIRDILHRVADRFPVHVLVWPVRVQGETCAQEVANGIKGFNALPQGGAIPRPDLIIVARGGGSLEDLWGFNEEEPVRAAAMSDIPLISAVGHETDVTLIDYAADLRAPTPTGAAEMALPVKSDLLATLGDLHLRQSGAVMRMMERRRSDFRSASRALPQPKDLLALARQRFDMASSRLGQSLQAATLNHRSRLATSSVRLRPTLIANKITLHKERLQDRGDRLARISLLSLEQKRAQLDGATRLLESLSHKGVLARGFTLVRNRDDEMIRQADQVSAGQGLSLEFADGHVSVVAGLLDPVTLTPSDEDKQSIAAQQEENVSGIMASQDISAEDIEANLRSLAGVKVGAKSGKGIKGHASKSTAATSSKDQSQPEKAKAKSRKSAAPKDDDAQGSLF
ncbi:MAG: exodeoxyribonuclease VII large subunit [Cohaesibacter sp.]|nr:exodeoxyribonuclease VII large subunit [Cohaesibacter sp.]